MVEAATHSDFCRHHLSEKKADSPGEVIHCLRQLQILRNIRPVLRRDLQICHVALPIRVPGKEHSNASSRGSRPLE
jgi:hypothetical protein